MSVADLPLPQLKEALTRTGLAISIGAFQCQIKSQLPSVHEHLRSLYADAECENPTDFVDFPVEVARSRGLRGWLRPQAEFTFNGNVPFTPLPLDQAPALLEWGINWCVSAHAHQYLVIHAAVVEKNQQAIIMPAPSGSGKSTLCTALVARGWRLLSDELALIEVASGQLQSIAKPMSLKNASIDIIRAFWPEAVFGEICKDTTKGTVAHVRPPMASMRNARELAKPAWVVFPRYSPEALGQLKPKEKGHTFMALVENAFNYHLLGADGFGVLKSVINQIEAFDFEYADLDKAVARFERLVE